MPDSKRFLHPEAIERISRLKFRARHIVEGFLSGMHRSPHFGQSVEFRQHREYAAGDDLRHVDWKVWARQDRLVVKQYDDDTNLRCHLLVDVSASMQYGNGPLNKYDYACAVAAGLAYLILNQQDAVGCIAFDESARRVVPTRSKRTHLDAIIDALEVATPRDKTDLFGVLRTAAEKFPRRGVTVLISDLLCDVDQTVRGLQLLRQRGHDVVVLHIMDDDELDFPFNGPLRFDGLESSDFLNCNPRALRAGYLEAVQEFLDQLRRQAARSSADYALIRTSDSLGVALSSVLTRRMRI